MTLLNINFWLLSALVVAGVLVCNRVRFIKNRTLLVGMILGLISCICSFYSVNVANIGVHICFRDVSVSLAVLFFTPVVGLIAGGIGALGRLAWGILADKNLVDVLPYAVVTLLVAGGASLIKYFICSNKRPGMLFTAMVILVEEVFVYIYLSFFISIEYALTDLLIAFLPEVFFKIICGLAVAGFDSKDDRLSWEYERINNVMIVLYIGVCTLVCYGMIYLTKLDVEDFMNGHLETLLQKNGKGVASKLHTVLQDIQHKEGISTAQNDIDSDILEQLAKKYGLQRLFICDNQGKLKGSNGDVLSDNKAFKAAWMHRFRQLKEQQIKNGCENYFVKDGQGLGDNMTFAYCQLEDQTGFILGGMDRNFYSQNIELLGLPDLWAEIVGMYGAVFIAREDTMVIEAINETYGVRLGKKIDFLEHVAVRHEKNENKMILVKVDNYSCFFKCIGDRSYYYCIIVPLERSFRPCTIVVRITFFLLAVVCLLVGRSWRFRLQERQNQEKLRQAEAKHRREDMATASTIQKSSLPNIFPPFPLDFDIDLFASMEPASEVGGDFYDYYYISPFQIAFLVADVSGKGIPAAMFMMRAKAMIKSNIMSGESLEEAMASVNRQLSVDNPAEMFVTCWVGILNKTNGHLEYVNAGHNPPYILHRDGSITKLDKVSGFFLAGLEDTVYSKHEAKLEADDAIFLYSDGVTEAENASGSMFEEARLELALKSFWKGGGAGTVKGVPAELCASIGQNVRRFVGNASQFDDITMLCLYYRGQVKPEHCEVAADLQGQKILGKFLEMQLMTYGCSQDFVYDMLMVFDEMASNVVNYSGSPKLTLDITHIDCPNMLKLHFIDSGKPYNPLQEQAPDLSLDDDTRPVGGLGVFIVKEMMDGVFYEYSQNENNVFMLKYINKPKEEKPLQC